MLVPVINPGRYKLDETFNGVVKAVEVAVIKPGVYRLLILIPALVCIVASPKINPAVELAISMLPTTERELAGVVVPMPTLPAN